MFAVSHREAMYAYTHTCTRPHARETALSLLLIRTYSRSPAFSLGTSQHAKLAKSAGADIANAPRHFARKSARRKRVDSIPTNHVGSLGSFYRWKNAPSLDTRSKKRDPQKRTCALTYYLAILRHNTLIQLYTADRATSWHICDVVGAQFLAAMATHPSRSHPEASKGRMLHTRVTVTVCPDLTRRELEEQRPGDIVRVLPT